MSLRAMKQSISEREENANNIADCIKLYMGEMESLTYQGKTLATWKTGSRGRTFLLKNKVIDELLEQKENGN